MTRATIVGIVLLLGLAPVFAGSESPSPARWTWWQDPCWPGCACYHRLCGWCRDDYVPKPYPCLPPGYRPCGCDDYAPRPVPAIPTPYHPKGCDDYLAKPLPPCPPVCPPPWYRCFPGSGCWK